MNEGKEEGGGGRTSPEKVNWHAKGSSRRRRRRRNRMMTESPTAAHKLKVEERANVKRRRIGTNENGKNKRKAKATTWKERSSNRSGQTAFNLGSHK
jgi:hypothetical protein